MSWYLQALRKYAVFSGRSQRMELWMFTLISYSIIFLFIGGAAIFEVYELAAQLLRIYYVAMIIPAVAVLVRRLHDSDHSGWWLIPAMIVPFVGVYFCCIDGTSGDNRFGPDPKTRST